MSYEVFDPPRHIEEYLGRVPLELIEEAAVARLTHQPPKYLVKGEWIYGDGRRYLDIAINYAWVDAVSNYKLVDGRLRWTCPVCGQLGGKHAKGCDSA